MDDKDLLCRRECSNLRRIVILTTSHDFTIHVGFHPPGTFHLPPKLDLRFSSATPRFINHEISPWPAETQVAGFCRNSWGFNVELWTWRLQMMVLAAVGPNSSWQTKIYGRKKRDGLPSWSGSLKRPPVMIQCSKHLEEMAGNNGTEQRLDNGFGEFWYSCTGQNKTRLQVSPDFAEHGTEVMTGPTQTINYLGKIPQKLAWICIAWSPQYG